MSHRIAQVNNVLQQEIAEILAREVDIKDFGLISVVKVETAPNLRSAKVYIQALKHNHKLLDYMNKKAYDLQQLLMQRVQLKHVPKILFRVDEGLLHASRIDELIAEEKKRRDEP